MNEMKFPESLTNNDNDSEFNDPGSELRFVWDRDAKVYVKKLVHRAVSFAGGQKFSAPLHKETCNCGTVPYVNGPKNGCPGPRFLQCALPLDSSQTCPGFSRL